MNPFREFFFPTERNGSVPYALSAPAAAVYLGIVVAIFVAPQYFRRLQIALLTGAAPFGSGDVVSLANAARDELGLPELKLNPALSKAAEAKARDMFEKQYFAHYSPENKTPWDFIHEAGYSYLAAGENLAIDYATAESAQAGFMNSPTHRSNILNKLYTEMGAAAVQGEFEGRPSIMIVQYFGKPRAAAKTGIVSAGSIPAPEPKTAAPITAAPVSPPPSAPATQAAPSVRTETEAAVLSAAQPSAAEKEEVSACSAESLFAACGWVRFAAILAIMSILVLAAAFQITRAGQIPPEIAFRTLAILVFLGLIAVYGANVDPLIQPHVAPAALDTVVLN